MRAGDPDSGAPPELDGAATDAGSPPAPENPLLKFSGLVNGKFPAALASVCENRALFSHAVLPFRSFVPSCSRVAFQEQIPLF